MLVYSLLLVVALAMVSLAHPAFHDKNKRSSHVEINDSPKDLVSAGAEFGPLDDVSRLLDRFARQIASTPRTPNGAKHWSPLHRDVLRGALQVTKQLLSYGGWTPNHLELLKGEQEILFEHVADDSASEQESAGRSSQDQPAPEGSSPGEPPKPEATAAQEPPTPDAGTPQESPKPEGDNAQEPPASEAGAAQDPTPGTQA